MQECTGQRRGKQEDGHATEAKYRRSWSLKFWLLFQAMLVIFPSKSQHFLLLKRVQILQTHSVQYQLTDQLRTSWLCDEFLKVTAHKKAANIAIPSNPGTAAASVLQTSTAKVQQDLAPNIPGHCSQEMFPHCTLGNLQYKKKYLQTGRY